MTLAPGLFDIHPSGQTDHLVAAGDKKVTTCRTSAETELVGIGLKSTFVTAVRAGTVLAKGKLLRDAPDRRRDEACGCG